MVQPTVGSGTPTRRIRMARLRLGSLFLLLVVLYHGCCWGSSGGAHGWRLVSHQPTARKNFHIIGSSCSTRRIQPITTTCGTTESLTRASFALFLQPPSAADQQSSSSSIREESTAAAIVYTEEEMQQIEALLAAIQNVTHQQQHQPDINSPQHPPHENKSESAPTLSDAVEQTILRLLPTLSASLLLKLRQHPPEDAAVTTTASSIPLPLLSSDITASTTTTSRNTSAAAAVASSYVNRVLQQRLTLARDTLQHLLSAGEIRQLDARIGQAAREQRLDAAFFNVLTLNLETAMAEAAQQQQPSSLSDETSTADSSPSADDHTNNNSDSPKNNDASHLQILRHVYTRCQEEVEKTLPPGTALLNKLLRTEVAAIRTNLYQHYLAPPATSLTTPDGRTVTLSITSNNNNNNNNSPSRVALTDFITALEQAVLQIRQVQAAGGTSRDSAARMVEGCRQVAKEARIVIGQAYGLDSEEMQQFQEQLQPVFRPVSAESPYYSGGGNGNGGA